LNELSNPSIVQKKVKKSNDKLLNNLYKLYDKQEGCPSSINLDFIKVINYFENKK